MTRRLSRRELLCALGAGAVFLPLLQATTVRGQGNAYPRRLVIVVQTNGVLRQHFHPQGDGNDLTAMTFPAMTSPLQPHVHELTFVGGLHMHNFTDYPGHGAGHENFSCTFTGAKGLEIDHGGARFTANSATIDQYIGNGLAHLDLPIRVLGLGVQIRQEQTFQSRCFYRGPNDPVTPENDPAAAFEAVFSGAQVGDDPELARLLSQRRSVLGHVGRDLERFAGRLGTEDKQKVLAHLASIEELQQQLDAGGAAGCSLPTVGDSYDVYNNEVYRDILDAQLDIIVHGFKCDRTRVATLQLTDAAADNLVFSWLGIQGGGQEFPIRHHHDVTHRTGTNDMDKIACEHWFMEQFAKLIQKLKDVPEGDGTMLDNTTVLWANHMGNGGAHSSDDIAWILAGSGGGALRTGQYLEVGGAPLNGVLKALCIAMEVDPNGFGDPNYGGALESLLA